jgi:hypothetical protein
MSDMITRRLSVTCQPAMSSSQPQSQEPNFENQGDVLRGRDLGRVQGVLRVGKWKSLFARHQTIQVVQETQAVPPYRKKFPRGTTF